MANDVAEILFDEIGLVRGGVLVGIFSGIARVNSDGGVTGIRLDAHRKSGAKTTLDLKVPFNFAGRHALTDEERLAHELSLEIERTHRCVIDDAVADAFDAGKVREYEAAE